MSPVYKMKDHVQGSSDAVKDHVPDAIGSFRNDPNVEKHLPKEIYDLLFGEILDGLDVTQLITLRNSQEVNVNNGAFGHAYDDVAKLTLLLREYSESNPDVFYDQVCLPLVNHSFNVAETFFGTENVLLVQNCTVGMRCIAESLIREQNHSSVAYLSPLYGATVKLLQYFESKHLIDPITKIAPGENPLFEENPAIIIQSLEDAYRVQQFTVLFCDAVASQSGRILPLNVVSEFCEIRGINLVVDGSQACQLFFGSDKEILQKIDYYVMSTHKWLGNSKTCGVIRFKEYPPTPPAISFGWNTDIWKTSDIKQIRGQYLWQGMSGCYISYITLAKALQIFMKYGEEQFYTSSSMMRKCFTKYLGVQPYLDESKERVLNICELSNSQLEPMDDVNTIQETLQKYGIFVSVKKFGKDCSGTTIDGQPMKTTAATEDGFQNGNSGDNSTMTVCPLKRVQKYYLRISCWSYNTEKDFESLGYFWTNNLRLSNTTIGALREQFLFTFQLYEKLFSVLATKAFFIRAERLRHHLIFYYGHTAVFFTNKLIVTGFLDPLHRFDPVLESSMSVGVDEMSWDDILEENYNWSGFSDEELEKYLLKVKDYRKWVKNIVLKLIDENPIVHPIAQDSLHWILLMGIEHEKIHLETSSVIISQVPIELIKKEHNFHYPVYWKEPGNVIANDPAGAPQNKLVNIPGGTVLIGKDHLQKDLYGWDNEFGDEKRTLKEFEASQKLVSNAEYLEFVQDGGYTEKGRKWWSNEGWRYVKDLNVTGPKFWVNQSQYRSMLEIIPMPWNLPVEVNNLEGEAFCNWKSTKVGKELRLISHAESFHMREIVKMETSNNNLNKYASPTPVNLYGGMINDNKIYDVSGNVWRHSVSVLTFLDGFKPHPSYNDFTLPTIDGYHNHILGGCWISLGNMSNLNGRYGFRRHFYQYAGIRYVCSENKYHREIQKMFEEMKTTKFITENYTDFTDNILVEKKPVKNWPRIFGEKAANVINNKITTDDGTTKVLIAHGGPGRITLEILRKCNNLTIDHTDNTANKLAVLESLLKESRIHWYQQLEGKITEGLEFHFNEGESAELLLNKRNNKIAYWQADYTNIRPQLNGYDVIVSDIRQKWSASEIAHLSGRLNASGLLVLGSIDNTGDDVEINEKHSLATLQKYFTRLNSTEEYPHIYRETRNKHQYAISHYSVWKKNFNDGDEIKNADQMKEIESMGQSLIQSSYDVTTTTDYYENQNILSSYDTFHFGDGLLSVENFSLKMSEVVLEFCIKFQCPVQRALDAGCGPGRVAIELCSVFDQVEAYDYSHGFINMLIEHKKKQQLENLIAYQGDSHKQIEIVHRKRFDLIFGCNLIDRLHSPELWIDQCKKMISPTGLIIVASPYTWKSEHTAPEKWIGGFKKDGENLFTVDGLRLALAPEFVLLEEIKVPFVIPDADGTFQYTYSNCTVFGAQR